MPSGRKECGVTPSGRMECGVMPSGRRISLKGAVTHFLLSFLLLPFPSSRNNLFPKFPNRRTTLFSTPLCSLRTTPVLSPLCAVYLPPPLSCPRCAPSARRHLVLSPLHAVRLPPSLSCLLLGARLTLHLYTDIHTLAMMKIVESSIDGNLEVLQVVAEQQFGLTLEQLNK